MLIPRVIPCLLLQDGDLVKTVKFSNPKYVGDPLNVIRIFNDKEVDEIIVLDIGVSKKGGEPDYSLIERFAGECFMPLCYGGGVRTVSQAQQIFKLGVEKVCLQTAALDDLVIINRIADAFGSQSLIVSVDVKKDWMGHYMLYRSAEGRKIRLPWLDFLSRIEDAGAGEIIVNSVDLDGTMAGIDIGLVQKAASVINVPLIAMGGVGSLSDIRAAIRAGASAVSAGAFFVFNGPHRAVLITYPGYLELEKLLGE